MSEMDLFLPVVEDHDDYSITHAWIRLSRKMVLRLWVKSVVAGLIRRLVRVFHFEASIEAPMRPGEITWLCWDDDNPDPATHLTDVALAMTSVVFDGAGAFFKCYRKCDYRAYETWRLPPIKVLWSVIADPESEG